MATAMVHTDLLNGLTEEDGERVLALGTRILLTSGAELFHLGDQAECIYLIAQGRLRLTLPMQIRGQDQEVLVEERAPGQTVGWSALIAPYRFTLTATAPLETQVIAFSRESLRKHFAANSDAGYVVSLNLANVIGERLQLFQAMWVREVQRMVEMRIA
jgi:CRP-like cAMP-binding protein